MTRCWIAGVVQDSYTWDHCFESKLANNCFTLLKIVTTVKNHRKRVWRDGRRNVRGGGIGPLFNHKQLPSGALTSTGLEAGPASLWPMSFSAMTLNLYCLPVLRLGMVMLVSWICLLVARIQRVPRDSFISTRYPVMGEPPSLRGDIQERVTESSVTPNTSGELGASGTAE